jgi:DNA-binding transcriptional LysR family regulator
MIASFQGSFLEVRVNQSYGYLEALIHQLRQRQIDIAICPITRAGVPESLEFQTLLPGRNVIACRAGHPLARKPTLKLDDIAPFPWIAPPPDSPLFLDLRQVLSEIGILDMRVNFSGGSLASMVNVLVGSDALTILPHTVLYMQRHAKQLHALPIRISHPDRQLGILWLRDDRNPAAVRLVQFLAQQFEAMQHGVEQFERKLVWRI